MQMERVVITGMDTVNALAKNTAAFARALQESACGIGPLTVFDTSGYRTCNGAEVKNFNPREMIPPSFSLKRMSRADNLALAATIEALKDAGFFPLPDDLRETTGVDGHNTSR